MSVILMFISIGLSIYYIYNIVKHEFITLTEKLTQLRNSRFAKEHLKTYEDFYNIAKDDFIASQVGALLVLVNLVQIVRNLR